VSNLQEIEDALNQLKDQDEDIRSQAALSLGWVGEEEVVEPLILALENDPSPKVRANAAMSLGQLGDKRAIDFLIGALKDLDSNVRGMVAYSLGLMKVDEALNPLMEILNDDPDKETRIAAADSIGQIGDLKSLNFLIRIFVQEENEDLKLEVKNSINKIGQIHKIDNIENIIQQEVKHKVEYIEQRKQSERERILEDIEREEKASKRLEQIEIISAKLPPMLEFAIHDETITYEKVCQQFDCDDITLELALNEMPKIGFDIEINSIDRLFKVLKPQAELSDEAKEKIKLLRRKFGIEW